MNSNYIREDDPMTNQLTIERDIDVPSIKRKAWAVIAVAFLLLFAAWCATAQTPACAWNEDCIAWNAPTTRTDGSAIAATDIASYVVESAPAGATTWAQLGTVTAPVQAYKRTGLKAGDAFDYRVSVVLKSGARSAPSEVKSATTAEPPPNSPVLKSIDTLAYEIKPNSTGNLVATRIGYIPMGTACGDRQQTIGTVAYTLVPRTSVDMVSWPSTVRLQDLWAKCS